MLAKKQPDVFGVISQVEIGFKVQKGIGLFFKKTGSSIFVFDVPLKDGVYGFLIKGKRIEFLKREQFIHFCCMVQGIRDKIYNNK
ncbi:MAG: hypothetical protein PUC18_12835 [Prevotellaceae bacterium]|nr:hypothetical protein [Prevotellaceae bacterium]